MNTPIALSRRAVAGRSFLMMLAIVLGFALNSATAADNAKPVPVSVSFEKATGETGPYVMTVTNTSSSELKVKISVLASVQVHNQPKNRELPEQKLDAGKSTTVNGLAATDKVTIASQGHASVELVVPKGTN